MTDEILERINKLFESPGPAAPVAQAVPDFVQRSFSVDDSRMNIIPLTRSSAKNMDKSDENLKNDGKSRNHDFGGEDGDAVVTMRDGLKCSGNNSDQFFSSGGSLAPYEYEREAFEIIFKNLQKIGLGLRFSYLFAQQFINQNFKAILTQIMGENYSLPAATFIGDIESDRDEHIFLAMQTTLLDSQHFETLIVDRLKFFCKTSVDETFVERLLQDLKLNFDNTNVYHFDDQQAQLGECVKFSFKSVKNSRRKMEDRYVIVPDLRLIYGDKLKNIFRKPASYFAIFDGHGGKECSSYAAIHLLGYIVHCILNEYENGRQVDQDRISGAIKNGFFRCDEFLNKKCERENLKSGTTAACAFIFDDVLYMAWVGDTQMMILDDGYQISFVTSKHSTKNEVECAKIVERGGMIFNILGANRVNGVLNITRCLGDQFMKPPLSAEPEIKTWRLDPKCKALLVASDGLFDGLPPPSCSSTIKDCVDGGNLGNAANVLVSKAKSGASTDNITTILVHFD